MFKRVDKEIVIAGYENAINLWIYSSQEVWARFNIMLSANAIIIAALVLLIIERPCSMPYFQIALPLMGIILCICWGLLNQRNNDFANYYKDSAREIEEKYLADYISVVSRGCNYAEGDTVKLILGNEKKKLRISCPANIHAIWISRIIIICFIILYILVLKEIMFN